MAQEVTQIVAPFWPPGIYESDWNNGPSPGHSNLVSVYICSGLMVVPYLAYGPTPDFNSGPGNDSNIGYILALQCLSESNLNNSPSPSHSNLVSDRPYICSSLLLMVSWWVPHLPKGCRPDFNNGPGGDSNSDPVLAPQHLFESRIMAPLQATPMLCQMKYIHLFKSPIYDFLVVPSLGSLASNKKTLLRQQPSGKITWQATS